VTVSIGLVGCGAWGRLILRDLLELGARVHVVVGTEAELGSPGIAGAASVNLDMGGITEPIDGFIVATPISTHAAIVDRLLPSGRPVFVEKPLSNDLDAARRIVARAGDRIFVMDKWRYHPGVEVLRDHARSGALGEIRLLRTFRFGWGTAHSEVDSFWTLLPHDLAIAYEILGMLPRARSTWCLVDRQVEFGFIARLADGDGGPEVVAEISISHPETRRLVVVIGSRGAAELPEAYADRILVSRGSGRGPLETAEAISIPTEMPLRRELKAFLAFLRGGPAPRSSAAEGLLVVERIAALRSMAGL